MILGKRVEKTNQNKYGFENINLENMKISSPTVLCFGGSSVVGRQSANGLAKFVFNMLNTSPKDKYVDVFSIVYGSLDSAPIDGTLTHQEIHNIVNNIFMPLVSQEGKKIDVLSAQKNMRNITIVSHCFGMAVANIVSTVLADNMISLGYTQQETVQILRQVTNISFAPLKARVIPLFSVIDFYSKQDMYSQYYSSLFASVPNSDKFASTKLNSQENHLSMLINRIIGTPKGMEPFDEHSIALLKRTENWNYYPIENFKFFKEDEKQKIIKKARTAQNFFSRGDSISKCFSFCITSSVENSIQNNASKNFEPLNLEILKNEIDYIINKQTQNEKKEAKNILNHIREKKALKSKQNNTKKAEFWEFCFYFLNLNFVFTAISSFLSIAKISSFWFLFFAIKRVSPS